MVKSSTNDHARHLSTLRCLTKYQITLLAVWLTLFLEKSFIYSSYIISRHVSRNLSRTRNFVQGSMYACMFVFTFLGVFIISNTCFGLTISNDVTVAFIF